MDNSQIILSLISKNKKIDRLTLSKKSGIGLNGISKIVRRLEESKKIKARLIKKRKNINYIHKLESAKNSYFQFEYSLK